MRRAGAWEGREREKGEKGEKDGARGRYAEAETRKGGARRMRVPPLLHITLFGGLGVGRPPPVLRLAAECLAADGRRPVAGRVRRHLTAPYAGGVLGVGTILQITLASTVPVVEPL